MERLESALAKARKARMRGGAPGRQGGLITSGRSPAFPAGDWAALQSLEISTRMAERKRLSALLGTQFSTPYDMMRSRLLRQMKKSGWRRLAVTSPNKGCGKTTLSANLALSLARQPELRVVLMDFDLRRPALASLFSRPERHNLAELLQGEVEFADYALRYGENLAICLNHTSVQNSAELLQSPATGEAIDRIEAQWKPDVIIFDTPPMQGNHDNLGFLSQVDCVLLVGAAGSTTLHQIDACEQELAGLTNVIGTVLNKCRYLDGEDGYSYGYY